MTDELQRKRMLVTVESVTPLGGIDRSNPDGWKATEFYQVKAYATPATLYPGGIRSFFFVAEKEMCPHVGEHIDIEFFLNPWDWEEVGAKRRKQEWAEFDKRREESHLFVATPEGVGAYEGGAPPEMVEKLWDVETEVLTVDVEHPRYLVDRVCTDCDHKVLGIATSEATVTLLAGGGGDCPGNPDHVVEVKITPTEK